MIEVAPNMFFRTWDCIESGYLHPGGVFIVKTISGKEYPTSVKDAPAAVEIWRKQFPELRQESAKQGVPEEIAFWLDKARREKKASQEG